MTSQHGAAQVVVDEDVCVRVKVKNGDGLVADCYRELDCQHIGAQIIYEILNGQQEIPENMKIRPDQCRLVLSVNERRVQLDNYKRLLHYREYLNGAPATLFVLDPEANIDEIEIYPMDQLGVQVNKDA